MKIRFLLLFKCFYWGVCQLLFFLNSRRSRGQACLIKLAKVERPSLFLITILKLTNVQELGSLRRHILTPLHRLGQLSDICTVGLILIQFH